MIEITKHCDSCLRTVTSGESSWDVWVSINLYAPFGVASRKVISLDICPYCQDTILGTINVNRKAVSREPLAAKVE